MRVINGFVTKSNFVSNTAGTVGEFLEISPIALTYAQHRGEYQHPSYPGSTLHTFLTKDTSNDTDFIVEAQDLDLAFTIVNLTLEYMGGIVGEVNRAHYTNFILAAMADRIATFTFGEIVVGTSHKLPDWISWTQQDAYQTEVRVWLRNEAFESQYSNYEIVVVPPIDVLDTFFTNYADVSANLKALTLPVISDRIQDARDGCPETYIRLMTFKFYNQNNPEQYTESHWGYIIYGRSGDNIDALKDATVDYLLSHSTRTEPQWQAIFPDVFKRTEFVLFPRWDKLSVINSNPLASLYASIYSPLEMLAYVTSHDPVGYPSEYISSKLRVLPFDYKGITCAVMPGQTNDVEKRDLETIFPDYLPLSTTSLDFNRMRVYTQEWVIKMVELIIAAETVTEFSTVLNPFRRIKRNNTLFISYLYDNINYLVAVRANGQ